MEEKDERDEMAAGDTTKEAGEGWRGSRGRYRDLWRPLGRSGSALTRRKAGRWTSAGTSPSTVPLGVLRALQARVQPTHSVQPATRIEREVWRMQNWGP